VDVCNETVAEQIRLVLADVLRTDLIRRAPEIARKIRDRLDVAVYFWSANLTELGKVCPSSVHNVIGDLRGLELTLFAGKPL
jgi:hypothetical protein